MIINERKIRADFIEFDNQLLSAISDVGISFDALNSLLKSAVRAVSARRDDELYRVIDSRLQALRKRGLIVYKAGKGWTRVVQLAETNMPEVLALTDKQVQDACTGMLIRGGKFASGLAELIEISDGANKAKLLATFDAELRKYLPK